MVFRPWNQIKNFFLSNKSPFRPFLEELLDSFIEVFFLLWSFVFFRRLFFLLERRSYKLLHGFFNLFLFFRFWFCHSYFFSVRIRVRSIRDERSRNCRFNRSSSWVFVPDSASRISSDNCANSRFNCITTSSFATRKISVENTSDRDTIYSISFRKYSVSILFTNSFGTLLINLLISNVLYVF